MRQNPFKKSTTLLLTFWISLGAIVASSWAQPVVVQTEFQMDRDMTFSLGHEFKKQAEKPILLAQNQTGSSSASSPASIVALKTESAGNEDAVVTIESTQAVQYTAFKLLNPLRLVLDFPNMQKGNLSGRIQVNKGLVDSIRPLHFEEAGVLRLEIALNKSADYEILKPNQKTLVVRLQSTHSEMAEAKKAASSSETNTSKIAGKNDIRDAATILSEAEKVPDDSCYPMLYGDKEPISLDFQSADVRNLFRIFAEISAFNIILSPEVSGSVNMRLMDVPWNEAMDVILANNGLGRECLGNNIVRVATQATLVAEDAARVADKQRAVSDRYAERNAQDLVTEVVHIDNADITALSASLNALKSVRGDALITVDPRTNTIILNDLRHHVDDMLETIRVLDVATAQVLIEAKIVEISKTFTQELGIQWGLNGNLTDKPDAIVINGPDSATSPNFLVDIAQQNNIGAAGLGNVAGFGLLLGTLIPSADINIQLEALETQGKGRIVSSPKVTTADNKEARIRSGRQIPYQTVSTDGTTTQFVNAELSLTVVPHVTSEEKIYMVIDATKNAADFTTFTISGIPTITTKEAHTEVLVGNGDTTVLGGIYESDSTENKKAVPFFSKIPFLGVLFRSFNESDNITELLIFITPTIVDNGFN